MSETSARRCERCRRASTRRLCDACIARTRTNLRDLIEFTALADPTPRASSMGGGKSSEHSLGVNIAALDVIAGNDTLPLMESWERYVRADFALAPYGVVTEDTRTSALLTRCVEFLSTWLDRLVDEWSPVVDFVSEVEGERNRLARIAQQDVSEGWRVECPTDVDDSTCGRRLRITSDALDDDSEIVCRACGTRWTARRLVLVAAADSEVDVWLPVDTITAWYSISARTLRRWASKGRVQRRGAFYSDRSIRAALASDAS
jgi:hypothetical protein